MILLFRFQEKRDNLGLHPKNLPEGSPCLLSSPVDLCRLSAVTVAGCLVETEILDDEEPGYLIQMEFSLQGFPEPGVYLPETDVRGIGDKKRATAGEGARFARGEEAGVVPSFTAGMPHAPSSAMILPVASA